MEIQGIWADEADVLHSEQWVNVYYVEGDGTAQFSHRCQVKDLKLDDFLAYGLEPIDAEGNVISVLASLGRIAS